MKTDTQTTLNNETSSMKPSVWTPLVADKDYEATVVSVTNHISQAGNRMFKFKFRTEAGIHTKYLMVESQKDVKFAKKTLVEAFGIEKLSEVPSLVGSQCTVTTELAQFASGEQKVMIRHINPPGTRSTADFDLDALDSLADEELTPIEDLEL